MKIWILVWWVVWEVMAEACGEGEECKNKWTYKVEASSLTKGLSIYSENPQVYLTISNPNITLRNPTVQVSNIPYSYTAVAGKASTCNASQICCSNISYIPSEQTVNVRSIGTTVMQTSLNYLDRKSSSKLESLSNSISNSKYKIEILPLQLETDFTNSYLISRNTNVTRQMQQRPMLIPQSFYKKTYQCQFLGLMDKTICSKSCSYIMTMQNLNQSGLYQLPNDVYFEDANLFINKFQDFNISITIFDPMVIPVINPLTSPVVKLVEQILQFLNNTYCLNLTLLNPTNESTLAQLFIDTTFDNVYENTILFEQYQSINVSICTPEKKYQVRLNGEQYNYEYNNEETDTTKNETIIDNIPKKCKGIGCNWWIWVAAGLGSIVFILFLFCIIRMVIVRRQRANQQLEDKFKSMAGMTLSTNASIPTLNDLTLQSTPHIQYGMMSSTGSIQRPMSMSRRMLVSPRIR